MEDIKYYLRKRSNEEWKNPSLNNARFVGAKRIT